VPAGRPLPVQFAAHEVLPGGSPAFGQLCYVWPRGEITLWGGCSWYGRLPHDLQFRIS